MSTQGSGLRIFALIPPHRRSEIARQLAPLQADVLFIGHPGEAEAAIHQDDVFQVGLLPGSLGDTDWRELWGLLALLDRRPALLVYTNKPNFELWSEVLDSGGYDVIVEPCSDEELQHAVIRAAKSFEQGFLDGVGTE